MDNLLQILVCVNKKLLESGTSNILFIKEKIFSPINKIYKGVTYKFFKIKLKKL